MFNKSPLNRFIAGKQQEMLNRLELLVQIESWSNDKNGIDRAGKFMAAELEKSDFVIERRKQNHIGDQIIARRDFNGKGRLLILGHLDTVWPTGTLENWPFQVTSEGFALGPGVGDMKGGLIVALTAVEGLVACDSCRLERITFLLVPDEEIGSPNSRELIESEATQADWVLVMEPGREDGGVVTSRAVLGKFHLQANGVSAHCGVDFERGASAVRELASKVEALEKLAIPEKGILVNVGVFRGGEARQVIPAFAEMHIDFRAPNQSECDILILKIKKIAFDIRNDKVTISLDGGQTRPEFPRSPGTLHLYSVAVAIADDMGMPLPEVHTQGGSDGSFAAALGVPTLDGLGPISLDDCSRNERVVIDSLVPRAELMARLIAWLSDETKESAEYGLETGWMQF
jgi:glutamate carboxypeptidase